MTQDNGTQAPAVTETKRSKPRAPSPKKVLDLFMALGSYAQKADTLQSIQSHMKQADEAEKKRRDAESKKEKLIRELRASIEEAGVTMAELFGAAQVRKPRRSKKVAQQPASDEQTQLQTLPES